MRQWITGNIALKLTSLAVAFLLWYTVVGNTHLASLVSVPIEYSGLSPDLEISSEIVPSVSLEVRGAPGLLSRFGANARLRLNCSAINRSGEHTFHIQESDIVLPPGVNLVRAIPSQLRFRFEKRATREVPVQVRFAAPPGPGLQISRQHLEPARVLIVGPESRVDRVSFATTDLVELSGDPGLKTTTVSAFVDDPFVRIPNGTAISVEVTLEKISADRQ